MTTLTRIDEKRIYKTPLGTANWPKLQNADTKLDPCGVYSVGLTFDKPIEVEVLREMTWLYDIAHQQKLVEEAKTQLPRELPPWKQQRDGSFEFKFKLKASGVFEGKTWTNRPPKLFDSKGNLIESSEAAKLRIGNGSKLIVFYQVKPFFVQKTGISLRLMAAQIVKLVDFDDRAYLGVEEVDGGYVHQPTLKSEPATAEVPVAALSEAAPVEKHTVVDDDIPF
jgi:hypothetical protein